MYVRLAWVLAGLTLLCAVADTLVTAAYRPLWSEASVAVHGFPFVTLAVLGSALMGALVISRYERHPIGWLLSGVGFFSSISLVTEAYSIWVTDEGGPGSASLGGVAGWISSAFGGQLSITGLAVMFLVAPDGHLLSRRWRYAAGAAVTGAACCLAALLTVSPTEYDLTDDTGSVSAVASALFSVGFLLITASLIASVVSMLRRLRRSEGEQRQQLRLIAGSAAFVAFGLVNLAVVQLLNGDQQTWAASLPLFVAYFCMPILFAVAVLRYRLYDIQVIVNRAVVLAVGTVFAAVGYTGLVVAAGALIDTQTGGFWLSLLATALVALAFQPLRRGVVRLANRLAYGSRAVPYEALSDFSRRLAETPAPDTLLPAVAEAAGRAVSASSVSAALEVPGAGVVSEVWTAGALPEGAQYDVPVRNGEDRLGTIAVRMPKGRSLRPADERLMHDLADQAALAFRNARMEAQLAEHVRVLDQTTRELADSRRRIIEADDAARRALESAITREVLPDLAALPTQLAQVRAAGANGAALDELERLVTQTNDALESLRELTRGVFPTQLARAGLGAALRSCLARLGLAAKLHVDVSAADRRFPARVEAAVYFCCSEALRAGSDASRVDLLMERQSLVIAIRGVKTDQVDVQAILDRVEAAAGSLSVAVDALEVSIPVGVAAATRVTV